MAADFDEPRSRILRASTASLIELAAEALAENPCLEQDEETETPSGMESYDES